MGASASRTESRAESRTESRTGAAGVRGWSMTWRKHDLSDVIEQIPIGVAVTLPLGTVEYANPRLLELLQVDSARVLGALLRDFRGTASASRDHGIRRRLFSGASWQGETQLRTARGEVRHVLESVFPLRDR